MVLPTCSYLLRCKTGPSNKVVYEWKSRHIWWQLVSKGWLYCINPLCHKLTPFMHSQRHFYTHFLLPKNNPPPPLSWLVISALWWSIIAYSSIVLHVYAICLYMYYMFIQDFSQTASANVMNQTKRFVYLQWTPQLWRWQPGIIHVHADPQHSIWITQHHYYQYKSKPQTAGFWVCCSVQVSDKLCHRKRRWMGVKLMLIFIMLLLLLDTVLDIEIMCQCCTWQKKQI